MLADCGHAEAPDALDSVRPRGLLLVCSRPRAGWLPLRGFQAGRDARPRIGDAQPIQKLLFYSALLRDCGLWCRQRSPDGPVLWCGACDGQGVALGHQVLLGGPLHRLVAHRADEAG